MGFPRVQYSWRCLKFLASFLFYLSLVGFASSILLGCWAYWLKIYVGDHVNLAEHGDGYLWPATVSLTGAIVVPVHVFGIGLRGALDKDFSYRRVWRKREGDGKNLDRLLFLHVILSCLSGILILSICAGSAYYWPGSRRRVRQGLQRAMRRYPSDESIKARFDRMQIELQCCGVESYADWFFLPWTRTLEYTAEDNDDDAAAAEMEQVFAAWRESIDQQRRNRRHYIAPLTSSSLAVLASGSETTEARGGESIIVATDVPYSCCSADVLRPCAHYNFSYDVVAPRGGGGRSGNDYELPADAGERSTTVSREGCQSTLIRRSNDAGSDVVACLLLVAAYQLTASIASRLLQTARGSALASANKGQHFGAWLFGSEASVTSDSARLRRCRDESSSSSNDHESRRRSDSANDPVGLSSRSIRDRGRHLERSRTRKKDKPERLCGGTTTTRNSSGDDRADDESRRREEAEEAPGVERYRDISRDIAAAASVKRMQILGAKEPAADRRRTSPSFGEKREVPLARNFNSTDFYGRFRGTLQDTLERRHRRVLDKSSASLAHQEQQHRHQQRRNSAIINKRERPAAATAASSATSSTSSLMLPSLPSTPVKRGLLVPREASTTTHPGCESRKATAAGCPVHDRCPVHSKLIATAARGGGTSPSPRSNNARRNNRCPVHGERVNFQL